MAAEPPLVACLTRMEVLRPTYQELAATMPKHTLVALDSADCSEARLAFSQAMVVIGDWTHQSRLASSHIRLLRRCRAIVQPTAGYDSIDVRAAGKAGIPVANVPGANARAVAEWVVMSALLLLKEVPHFDQELRAGRWLMVEAAERGVYELADRTVGIVGLGGIGLEVARRLVDFEPKELVYADVREVLADLERELGLRRVDIDDVFRLSDVVTLHVPLTSSTRHLVNQARLRLLGPQGVLVNTARGGVVDSEALIAALTSGGIKGAALDVFEDEPLGPEHQWADVPRLLLSPHLAGSTNESRQRMITRCLGLVARVLRGQQLVEPVNSEFLCVR